MKVQFLQQILSLSRPRQCQGLQRRREGVTLIWGWICLMHSATCDSHYCATTEKMHAVVCMYLHVSCTSTRTCAQSCCNIQTVSTMQGFITAAARIRQGQLIVNSIAEGLTKLPSIYYTTYRHNYPGLSKALHSPNARNPCKRKVQVFEQSYFSYSSS